MLMAVLFPFFILVQGAQSFRREPRIPSSRQKNRSLGRASPALPQGGGVACRPVIGQWRGRFRRADRPSLYNWHANAVALKKPFRINRKILIAGF
jgi:hypothetical protein